MLYHSEKKSHNSSKTALENTFVQLFRTVLEEIVVQGTADFKEQRQGKPLRAEGPVQVLRSAVNLLGQPDSRTSLPLQFRLYLLSKMQISYWYVIVSIHIYTKLEKPMKAMARMPAVMSAMGTPFIPLGISTSSSCSRRPAKMTMATVKPMAMNTE